MAHMELTVCLPVLGVVRTGHQQPQTTPIQAGLNRAEHGTVEIAQPFQDGVAGFADSGYAWLLTWPHRPRCLRVAIVAQRSFNCVRTDGTVSGPAVSIHARAGAGSSRRRRTRPRPARTMRIDYLTGDTQGLVHLTGTPEETARKRRYRSWRRQQSWPMTRIE